jgi:hypothetical protein
MNMKKNLLRDLAGRKEFKSESKMYIGLDPLNYSYDYKILNLVQPSAGWAWKFVDAGGSFNLPSPFYSTGLELDCALALDLKGVCPVLTAEYIKMYGEVLWVPSHYIKRYHLIPETIEDLEVMMESYWYDAFRRSA